MKWMLNLLVACALLMVGYVWGQMNQKAYIDGMKAQCEVMVEKAYNAGLYGCAD